MRRHSDRPAAAVRRTAVLACLLTATVSGCLSMPKCMEAVHNDKLACRGWRARKDCFAHEGKDFRYGFLDGYIAAMHGGADVCEPVVPPQRYWSSAGCRGRDCGVVASYYNGWGQGVAAAAQDGMASFAQVPLRARPKLEFPGLVPVAAPAGPHPVMDEVQAVEPVQGTPFDLSAPYEALPELPGPPAAGGDSPLPPAEYFPEEEAEDAPAPRPEEADPAEAAGAWTPRTREPARVSLDLQG